MRRLLMPGDSESWEIRRFLMANPTPWILGSTAAFPFQKKVYPPFSSFSCPSSARRVSDRAAMSRLHRLSSLAKVTDLLSGRLLEALPKSVLTLQAPKLIVFVFVFSAAIRWTHLLARSSQTSLSCSRHHFLITSIIELVGGFGSGWSFRRTPVRGIF